MDTPPNDFDLSRYSQNVWWVYKLFLRPFSWLWRYLFGQPIQPKKTLSPERIRILILGLDGSGKTTIIYNIKLGGNYFVTIPTIGFNNETVVHKDVEFDFWDLGGQITIRPLWRHYYDNTKGIIWVVDSTNRARMEEVKHEMEQTLRTPALKGVPVLIFANKQDLANSMTWLEVAESLDLAVKLSSHPWHVHPSSMPFYDDLFKGLDWIYNALKHV